MNVKRLLSIILICLFISIPAYSEEVDTFDFDPTIVNSMNKTTTEWYSASEERALLTVLLGYSIHMSNNSINYEQMLKMLKNNTYVGKESDEKIGNLLVIVGIAEGKYIIIYYSPETGLANCHILSASSGQSAEYITYILCGKEYYMNDKKDIQEQIQWVEDNLINSSAKSTSDLKEFSSVMMESVSSQINEATDLTISPDSRAVLAAMLSLELANQEPSFVIDYTLPIYVCKQGRIASVAIGGEEDYALIIYQMNPLSTSYGFLYGNNPLVIKSTLEITNDVVWQVPISDYTDKLATLVKQIE